MKHHDLSILYYHRFNVHAQLYNVDLFLVEPWSNFCLTNKKKMENEEMALMRLHICASSSVTSLVDYVIY